VLVTVMRDQSEYFALEDSSGQMLPHFLAVLNTEETRKVSSATAIARASGALQTTRAFLGDGSEAFAARAPGPAEARYFPEGPRHYYEKTRRVQRLCIG